MLAATALLAATVVAAALSDAAGRERLPLAAVWLLPILLPLRGLLAGRRRTHAWATLCVLPYLVFGVSEAVANPAARAAATAVVFAGLVWFGSLVAYLRVTRAEIVRPPASPTSP